MPEISLQNRQPSLTTDGGVEALVNGNKHEVLKFLAARPLSTFIQTSWIRDNGLVSPHNRGMFYGYRDAAGQLAGVALVGHITLFETQNDLALAAFANLAHTCPSAYAILGEKNQISRFMVHFLQGGPPPRLACRELLLQKQTAENLITLSSLRPANPEELELVVPVHAQTAFKESGINPLDVDAVGFTERCAHRIKQGRVWVSIENGRLKFKADVVSDTPDVVYLEGVYVSAEHRANGYGARCLTQLTNYLLERTKSVCLLVNETNSAAQKSYQKAGYQFREHYETLFLQ